MVGTAKYYDITVNGVTLKDGAWYFPEPNEGFESVKDYVTFRKLDYVPIFASWVATRLTCRRSETKRRLWLWER
jgi:uncharacterized protein (DUF427 family)